ncbi:MAG: hypothetical protein PHW73_01335 [Atribacterota bacterium]|nr:hypothetical protein [Atribacterota bacterium]
MTDLSSDSLKPTVTQKPTDLKKHLVISSDSLKLMDSSLLTDSRKPKATNSDFPKPTVISLDFLKPTVISYGSANPKAIHYEKATRKPTGLKRPKVTSYGLATGLGSH